MRAGGVLLVAVVAGVLLAGVPVQAAEGSLRPSGPVTFAGGTLLQYANPLLLVRSASGALEFEVSGASGVLDRTYEESASVGGTGPDPVFRLYDDRLRTTERIDLRDATIRLVAARAGAAAMLFPAGESKASARTAGDVVVAAADPTVVSSHPESRFTDARTFPHPHEHEVEEQHLNATLDGGELEAVGAFGFYLFDVDVEVRQGGSVTRYQTGLVRTGGAGPVAQEHVEKIVLSLDSAKLVLRTLDDVQVRVATLDAATEGTAAFVAARGSLRDDGATWTAEGGDVVVRGAGEYAFSVEGGSSLVVLVAGDVSTAGFRPSAIVAAPRFPPHLGLAIAGGGLLVVGLAAVAWRRRRAASGEGAIEHAVALLDAGNVAGALAAFESALASDPRNATLHLDRAQVLDRLGRTSEARRAYETAVRYAPESGEAHYQLARSLAASGLAASAIAHLSQAFSLDPAFAATAREEDAFRPLLDHPTYRELAGYYERSENARA